MKRWWKKFTVPPTLTKIALRFQADPISLFDIIMTKRLLEVASILLTFLLTIPNPFICPLSPSNLPTWSVQRTIWNSKVGWHANFVLLLTPFLAGQIGRIWQYGQAWPTSTREARGRDDGNERRARAGCDGDEAAVVARGVYFSNSKCRILIEPTNKHIAAIPDGFDSWF